MPEFRFHAPALLDRGAGVDAPADRFHGAPAAADINAPFKRFARWLAARLGEHGFRVEGPEPDEEGWILAIASNGASVQIVIYSGLGEPDQFVVDVIVLGPADPAIAQACETILRSAPEVRGLIVR
jgi:hypothetical protein